MKHYHVNQGMHGGYMPDTSETFSTLTEACLFSASLAREWRDELDENDKAVWSVRGSARVGHYEITRREPSPTELGFYISIDDCYEDDCFD